MSAAEREQAAAVGAVRVSVPATSANLGVGFDVLGLALDLAAEFAFEPADTLKIDGCAPELAGEDNLVWTSYLCGCREFGLEAQPLHITESCTIPSSGGLGSSSTCVVAGIAAAQALSGLPLDRERTLSLATAIEGHPDNVAPAVMGGLVSSYVEEATTVTTRWVVADNLRFVCMAPPYRVLTRDARRALPAMVPTSTVSWQGLLAGGTLPRDGERPREGRCRRNPRLLPRQDSRAVPRAPHPRLPDAARRGARERCLHVSHLGLWRDDARDC